MRIIYLILLFLCITLSLTACSNKPEKNTSSSSVDLPKNSKKLTSQLLELDEEGEKNTQAPAIWFTLSDFKSGGRLARLDLKTGKLKQDVQMVPPDAILLPDGKEQLFLIGRFGPDGITVLSGEQATPIGNRSLKKFSNPQFALRDPLNRIWVTYQELNLVEVYSPDLSTLITQLDVSSLGDRSLNSPLASVAQLELLDDHQIAVTAQRLDRKTWIPHEFSGLAVFDTVTFKLNYSHLIPISNPTRTFLSGSQLFILGSGDLAPSASHRASLGQFEVSKYSLENRIEYPNVIYSAHIYSPNKPPAVTTWHKDPDKTCAQIGEKEILCEKGGYFFSKILRVGNHLYLARSDRKAAQLWIVSIEDGTTQKVDLDLPIQSMIFGP